MKVIRPRDVTWVPLKIRTTIINEAGVEDRDIAEIRWCPKERAYLVECKDSGEITLLKIPQ